jgi:hypothetical protein
MTQKYERGSDGRITGKSYGLGLLRLQKDPHYRRPPMDNLCWVPEVYGSGGTVAERDAGEG